MMHASRNSNCKIMYHIPLGWHFQTLGQTPCSRGTGIIPASVSNRATALYTRLKRHTN